MQQDGNLQARNEADNWDGDWFQSLCLKTELAIPAGILEVESPVLKPVVIIEPHT